MLKNCRNVFVNIFSDHTCLKWSQSITTVTVLNWDVFSRKLCKSLGLYLVSKLLYVYAYITSIIWIIIEPKSDIELRRLWLSKSRLINGCLGFFLFVCSVIVWFDFIQSMTGERKTLQCENSLQTIVFNRTFKCNSFFSLEWGSYAQKSIGIATQAWSWNVFTLLRPLVPESAQDSLTQWKM